MKDGTQMYTLPAIYDPSTGAAVSDSPCIAEYLDETYPNTPKLFPPGTRALQYAFMDAHVSVLSGSLWQFAMPATNMILNPRSEEYYRRTREAFLFGGRKLEDVVPKGEEREIEWAKVREGHSKFDGWLQKGDGEGPYLLGNTICFSDFVLAAFIMWFKKIWGEDSVEWKDIESWDKGRWVSLLKRMEKYETTDA
jgi:glutathione S-transferase